jgi:hypothetical protein
MNIFIWMVTYCFKIIIKIDRTLELFNLIKLIIFILLTAHIVACIWHFIGLTIIN